MEPHHQLFVLDKYVLDAQDGVNSFPDPPRIEAGQKLLLDDKEAVPRRSGVLDAHCHMHCVSNSCRAA